MSTTPNDPNSGGYGGAPSYGSAPAAGSGSNPLAIVALIAGILSVLALCVALIPFVGPILGVILGIAAIVTGRMATKKVRSGQAGQGGLAKAGFITGIVGLVLNVIVLGLTFAGVAFLGQVENCNDPSLSQQEIEACVQEELGN